MGEEVQGISLSLSTQKALVNLFGIVIALLERFMPRHLVFYFLFILSLIMYLTVQIEISSVETKVTILSRQLEECEKLHSKISSNEFLLRQSSTNKSEGKATRI